MLLVCAVGIDLVVVVCCFDYVIGVAAASRVDLLWWGCSILRLLALGWC